MLYIYIYEMCKILGKLNNNVSKLSKIKSAYVDIVVNWNPEPFKEL